MDAKGGDQYQGDPVAFTLHSEGVVIELDGAAWREAVVPHCHDAVAVDFIPRGFVHIDKPVGMAAPFNNMAYGSQAGSESGRGCQESISALTQDEGQQQVLESALSVHRA